MPGKIRDQPFLNLALTRFTLVSLPSQLTPRLDFFSASPLLTIVRSERARAKRAFALWKGHGVGQYSLQMSSPAASHRARKKKKFDSPLTRTPTTANVVTFDGPSNTVKPEFPLVAFLWPARGTTSQWILIPLVLIAVGLFRWTVGLWGYSGQSFLMSPVKNKPDQITRLGKTAYAR